MVTASSANATYAGTEPRGPAVRRHLPGYFEASNDPVERGTYFTADDVLNDRKVVVIGQTVHQDLFGTVDPIGKQITVGGVNFTVVGRADDQGRRSGFQDADDVAIAPLPAVQESLTGYGALSQIVVEAKTPRTVDAAQTEITAILNQRHGITGTNTADFRILNQATLQSRDQQQQQDVHRAARRGRRPSACWSAASASPTSCW